MILSLGMIHTCHEMVGKRLVGNLDSSVYSGQPFPSRHFQSILQVFRCRLPCRRLRFHPAKISSPRRPKCRPSHRVALPSHHCHLSHLKPAYSRPSRPQRIHWLIRSLQVTLPSSSVTSQDFDFSLWTSSNSSASTLRQRAKTCSIKTGAVLKDIKGLKSSLLFCFVSQLFLIISWWFSGKIQKSKTDSMISRFFLLIV
jgi:hypothetical protein